MNKVKIERLDDFGRGIGYINDKVTFISGAIPGEEVECEIIKESKKYNEAKLFKIIKESDKRIISKCKYYKECGGCHLQHLSYEDSIEFKKNKLKNIFNKNKISINDIDIIKNNFNYNYRNKIELKVKDGKIGFYENKSHNIVSIDECIVAKKCINSIITALKKCDLEKANITIRANYNEEILLIVDTNDKFNYENLIKNNKIVGIILNDKLIYGEDYFTEVINDLYFKVSYNSFFQINEYICSKLFEIIDSNIDNNSNVLDLYCGVGTLSLVASKKANKVYGIEIVENAILNAITNAKINKRDNLYFMCGDVPKLIDKIDDNIDIIIVDPPRAGLDKKTIDTIIKNNPKKIIYVSCDPQTLVRDLKILEEYYDIKKATALDMFSYTYHCESITILERR
ncbi:MAG: class I SAM-dependent RNA methyltransferase [Firmicutes bacterium]|nr:class I SAM-dependent RNA methyltransferase [Bacillota bacterium]